MRRIIVVRDRGSNEGGGASTGKRFAFAALLGIGALDATGYGIIAPVAPEIAERTGAGPGLIGALVTSFALGQLVGYPLAGRWIERRHASAVLLAALALMAAGDVAFILGDGLWVYFPARAVQGVGAGGLWMGAVFALLERFPGEAYRRLTGLLAAYSVGGVAGPGLGAFGGIAGPFAAHLALVGAAAAVLGLLGAPRERPAFRSDRAALRAPGFVLSSAGVVLVAVGIGTLEGPLPLHFSSRLDQAEVAALYVGVSCLLGASAVAAGYTRPRRVLAAGLVLVPVGIAVVGFTHGVSFWLVGLAVAAVGLGVAEAGSLGVLLDAVGMERMVLAMVIWSLAWGAGYLAAPASAGALAEGLGYSAVSLVPLAGALLVAWALARDRPAASAATTATSSR